MKSLFGGSDQQSSQSSSSGFRELPDEIKNVFINLANQAQGMFGGGGQAGMFTPTPLDSRENGAIDSIMAGTAPTSDSIKSDVSMQMNPFDDYVIQGINREAEGQGSVLKSMLTGAGQYGSNRGALSANDIDTTRLQQIGQFKQGQFNTAMNNALTTLPQTRLASAQNVLAAGDVRRNFNSQVQQAPYTALTKFAALLGALPQNGGAVGSGSSSGSSQGAMFQPIKII